MVPVHDQCEHHQRQAPERTPWTSPRVLKVGEGIERKSEPQDADALNDLESPGARIF
jgi:hypothetical protein